jgi:hypothetical protein
MPYWAHPQNQTLTGTLCRCFVFHARKTPGFGGYGGFVLKMFATEFVYRDDFKVMYKNLIQERFKRITHFGIPFGIHHL